MPKYTNERIVEFKNSGIIRLMRTDEFRHLYRSITGKHAEDWRRLLTVFYFTGARPIEVIDLTAGAFERKGSYLWISIHTAKRGMDRRIALKINRYPELKELWEFVKNREPTYYIFGYCGLRSARCPHKAIARRIGLPPYFFRHNRFSLMAEAGASDRDLQYFKGSRSLESVECYRHYSTFAAEKAAKFI